MIWLCKRLRHLKMYHSLEHIHIAGTFRMMMKPPATNLHWDIQVLGLWCYKTHKRERRWLTFEFCIVLNQVLEKFDNRNPKNLGNSHFETGHFKTLYFWKLCFHFPELQKVRLNSSMTKFHKYKAVSKMSLIQPVRFRSWETRLCRMKHLICKRETGISHWCWLFSSLSKACLFGLFIYFESPHSSLDHRNALFSIFLY